MANTFDIPDNSPVVEESRRITLSWLQWASRVHRIVSAVQQSGPTASRPTSLLWVGRTYFDTTLGIPVWVSEVSPAVVWVDATGTPA